MEFWRLINSEVVTQHMLIGELVADAHRRKRNMLADCQLAADREDAAQRKLGGLNMAIFALDRALRLVRANPARSEGL